MKLRADLHIHTVASGHAFSTVQEVAQTAAARGLELIAITDHGPALPGGAHPYHFWNLRVLPEKMFGVRFLKGAEVNIIDSEGNVDLDTELLQFLDLVLVGLHPRCGYEGKTKEENTKVLIGAIKNPYVDVLVHPGNLKYPFDIEKVVKSAQEYGVLLELNNSSYLSSTSRKGSYELDLEIARTLCQHNLEIIIGSDAHIASAVGQFSAALDLAQEVGIGEDLILNTSPDKVFSFLEKRKKKRF